MGAADCAERSNKPFRAFHFPMPEFLDLGAGRLLVDFSGSRQSWNSCIWDLGRLLQQPAILDALDMRAGGLRLGGGSRKRQQILRTIFATQASRMQAMIGDLYALTTIALHRRCLQQIEESCGSAAPRSRQTITLVGGRRPRRRRQQINFLGTCGPGNSDTFLTPGNR